MDVGIHEVSIEDNIVLRHLMQLYLYDFSEFAGWDLDEHALFGYKYLDFYWVEPNRHPYLIRVDGHIAGFALVTGNTDDVGNHARLSEFFVVRKYRRQGVGEAAARMVFGRFPGRWVVSEMEENVPAQAFWRGVIHRYTGGDFEERHLREDRRIIQTFTT